MDKKCGNCVFCQKKPEDLAFLPNDWICECPYSKWRGYWPPTGTCDNYVEPTGRSVAEVLGEKRDMILEKIKTVLNDMGEESSDELIEAFLKKDSAILDDFTRFFPGK